MASRIIQPVSPYLPPVGFSAVPLAAAAFDPADPNVQVTDRGTYWLQDGTKSTHAAPQCFLKEDVCGNEYYKKGSVSSSINKLQNCEIVSIFQGSFTCTIPKDMSRGEFSTCVGILMDELWSSTLTTNLAAVV